MVSNLIVGIADLNLVEMRVQRTSWPRISVRIPDGCNFIYDLYNCAHLPLIMD